MLAKVLQTEELQQPNSVTFVSTTSQTGVEFSLFLAPFGHQLREKPQSLAAECSSFANVSDESCFVHPFGMADGSNSYNTHESQQVLLWRTSLSEAQIRAPVNSKCFVFETWRQSLNDLTQTQKGTCFKVQIVFSIFSTLWCLAA